MSFWPAQLIEAIARRRAVILIGSGVSANAVDKNGDHPPTWGAFLEAAHKKLPKKLPHIKASIKSNRYLETCFYLKEAHGSNWKLLLNEAYGKPKYKPADIHKAIFNLDCRVVASLNFDKIYENYAISVAEDTYVVKNYYEEDIRQVVAGNERYILKPHGSIDTVSKLIFTVDDYAKARVENSAFYEIMTALLHTHTILCIGCGLADPDIQWIFEDYRYKYSECPHYITFPEPINTEQEKMLAATRGLNILPYSSKAGHIALTKNLQELVVLVNNARTELAKTMNW